MNETEYFNEETEWLGFYHSGENVPFLTCRCIKIVTTEDCVKVYSKDYENPIATVFEYDYWIMK